MPSGRAEEFRRVAARLGFEFRRKAGSHERWIHSDGLSVTIPFHGGKEIGPPLFHRILDQIGISAEELGNLSEFARSRLAPTRHIKCVSYGFTP
jgi:predicted RNA binding protein YcfA (HicA-like mRNA interferase family)